jgi:hypothetical protein
VIRRLQRVASGTPFAPYPSAALLITQEGKPVPQVVHFKISDFGSELQESFDFEIVRFHNFPSLAWTQQEQLTRCLAHDAKTE